MRQRSIQEFQCVCRERDLCDRLLALGRHDDLEPFLSEALKLAVETIPAERAYLAVEDRARSAATGWTVARDLDDPDTDRIRERLSRGSVAKALADGQVATFHRVDDGTVNQKPPADPAHEALCAPVLGDDVRGEVYLERDAEGSAFSEADRDCLQLFVEHLGPLAEHLVARAALSGKDDRTRKLHENYVLDEFVGRSASVAEALENAMLAAPLDVNILLTGDSGTGKTLLARLIHEHSNRKGGPFVEISCAALPEALLENELFGAVRGGHSTATRLIEGKVTTAERGTLFLDEVGDLPLGSQAKLLQLLQSHEYYPLGSATPRRADFRVIAATNRNLELMVEQSRFREDLYFRLHVLEVRLPSLAERREDLPALAQAACARVITENRLPSLTLSSRAIRTIEATDWPGNVRELEARIASAAIRAAGEQVREIDRRHLFPERFSDSATEEKIQTPLSFHEATRRFQCDLVARTLSDTSWNVAESARRLDLARSHVYKLIEVFGLKRS